MKGNKTMNINVNGTVDELIAFAELLKAGKKAQEPEKPIESQKYDYVAIAVEEDIISAIKECRHNHATGKLSLLKGAMDHVESLLAKAVESGDVCVDNSSGTRKYKWV
jgi:hypothetical protein